MPEGLGKLVPLLFGGLYLCISLFFLSEVPPTGETASWASPDSPRTVLQAQRLGQRGKETGSKGIQLAVAGEPSLEGSEVAHRNTVIPIVQRRGTRSFGLELADERYRAALRLGKLRLGWSQNDYSWSGFDWPLSLVHRSSGSLPGAQALVLLGGALLIALVCGMASRVAGLPAGLIAGVFLVADPWFHFYRRMLGTTELALGFASLLGTWLLLRALEPRDGQNEGIGSRQLLLAGLVLGLGLAAKLSFVAVLLPLALLSFAHIRKTRQLLPVLLGLALGVAPQLFSLAEHYGVEGGIAQHPTSLVGNDSIRGRLAEQRDLRGDRSSNKEHSSSEASKKSVSFRRFVLDPSSFWLPYLGAPSEGRGGATAVMMALAPLGLLALVGVAVQSRARWWMSLSLLVTLSTTLLHPDVHHVATILPLLALALGCAGGAGITRLWGAGHRWVGGALLLGGLLFVLLRLSDMAAYEAVLAEGQARRWTASQLEELVDDLEELDVSEPAVFDYELLPLLEGYTAGRIRPWHWWRSNRPMQPPAPVWGRAEWLELVLEAHLGGHLLITPGARPPGASRGSGQGLNGQRFGARGLELGLRVERLKTWTTGAGGTYAELYAVRSPD